MGWKWEEPGRFLRQGCKTDSWEGEREESCSLQCGSKRVSARLLGVLSSSHPSGENRFSQHWAYFLFLLGACGKRGLCQRRWCIHYRRPEWHIFVAATPHTEIHTTLRWWKHITYKKGHHPFPHFQSSKNIWVQKGQDGIVASLTTNLETRWERNYKDIVN